MTESTTRRHRSRLAGSASVGLVTLLAGACVLVLGPSPAFGAGPDTGTGSAFGIIATGPLKVKATPSVTLPAGGVPAQTKSGVALYLPPLADGGFASVATSSSHFSQASESVTSSASVNNLYVLGPPLLGSQIRRSGIQNVLFTVAATTSCTSNANGSSASVNTLKLSISGKKVTFPTPLPANYNLPAAQLGPLAGLLLVTLNAQNGVNTANSTTTDVAALSVVVLGNFNHGETVTVAHSACSASGPDIHPVNSVVPESSAAVALPLAGGLAAVVAAVVVIRRRRLRSISPVP